MEFFFKRDIEPITLWDVFHDLSDSDQNWNFSLKETQVKAGTVAENKKFSHCFYYNNHVHVMHHSVNDIKTSSVKTQLAPSNPQLSQHEPATCLFLRIYTIHQRVLPYPCVITSSAHFRPLRTVIIRLIQSALRDEICLWISLATVSINMKKRRKERKKKNTIKAIMLLR